MVKNSIDTGGLIYNKPQDHDQMYEHYFDDLKGHKWEFYSNESAIPQQYIFNV